MATASSLAIRNDEAYARIEAAILKLSKAAGVALGTEEDPRHRDPAIEQIQRTEQIADALEKLAIASGQPSAAQSAALQKAKADADAPLTVETVDVVAPTSGVPKGVGK